MYFRIKKERIMTYTHLGIESTKSHTQALCSGQILLNTVLQSRLKKRLGFSTKQHSFSIFSGAFIGTLISSFLHLVLDNASVQLHPVVKSSPKLEYSDFESLP